jgi:hypothetical protein
MTGCGLEGQEVAHIGQEAAAKQTFIPIENNLLRRCRFTFALSSAILPLKFNGFGWPDAGALKACMGRTIIMAGAQQELAKLKWEDPLLLDELLTDDERMIRDTARAYAQDKLLPRVIEAYREEGPTAPSSTRWVSSASSA